MPNGEMQPFISQESVQAALDRLLYTSMKPPPNPLSWLTLIDEYLADPDFPPSSRSRDYALNAILTTQISEALAERRLTLGLAAPQEKSSLEMELAAIQKDAGTGNHDLIGWADLYYRYVRVDLGLSPETLSAALHIDARTLRRHHPRGLEALVRRLTDAEWQARRRRRERRLLAAMRVAAPTALYGRDEAFRLAAHVLEGSRPHHLLITGQPGIGKSTFVRETLRQEIAAGHLAELIWITCPESIASVLESLTERLIPEGAKSSLMEQLIDRQVAVVLDDISLLSDNPEAIEDLLDMLGNAQVYLTTDHHVVLKNVAAHISLAELSQESASDLIRSLNGADSGATADFGDFLWETAGGNPLALKLAARSLWLHDLQTVSRESLGEIFGRSQAMLTPSLRQAWCAFALFPPGPVNAETVCRLWPTLITSDAISELLRQNLLDRVMSEQLIGLLTQAARRYIEASCQADPEMRQAIDSLVNALGNDLPLEWAVIAHILSLSWLAVEPEQQHGWIRQLWEAGLAAGHWAIWRALAEHDSTLAEDSALLLAYGLCQRHLGDWEAAQHTFEQVIALTGKRGEFVEQASAALELAILFRYQGKYNEALSLIDRSEGVSVRYGSPALAHRIRLEQAQIALDAGEGVEVNDFLATLPVSARVLALRSESCLRSGDLEAALEFAQEALRLAENDRVNSGRLYGLLAKLYDQQNDTANAQLMLQGALTLLEQEEDRFALARTQSNLGALLIQTQDYDEALRLLVQAEAAQVRLNDRIGLESTRHNLRILHANRGIGD